MKKLSSLFVLLCASVMAFAANYKLTALDNVQPSDEVVIAWLKADAYYAITNSNGTSKAPAATAVTVSNDVLTTDNAALVWNLAKVEGGYTIYPAGVTDKWLYITATNNGVRVGTNENKIFLIDATNGYLAGNDGSASRYLGIYNTQDVRCYTSVNSNIQNQEIKFFVKEDGGSTTDDPVAVTDVTLDQATASVEVGKTVTLVATVAPENATNKNITWATSNADVATVADGVVTAVATGEAIITVTTEDGAKTAQCVITVTEASSETDYRTVHTSNVELNISTEGSKSTYDGTVNGNKAIKAGTGSATGTAAIMVPAYTTKLYFHAAAWNKKTSTKLLLTGATATPAEFALTDDSKVSGNGPAYDIADADNEAFFFTTELTGITAPTTLLFTPSGDTRFVIWGVNAEQTLPEPVPATGITLSETALSIENYKNTVALTATVTPENTTDVVEWSIADETVATINSLTGVITALKEGTTTITAKAGDQTATCALTVTAPVALTCAQAVEKATAVAEDNAIAAGGKYVVRGYVTEIVSDDLESSYHNCTYWVADELTGGQQFEAYRVVPADDKTMVNVGDYVELIGDLTQYKGTPQIKAGSVYEILIKALAGAYNVGGENADFASLAEACAAINNSTIAGDIQLLVCADLVEPKNMGIKNGSDHTITITVDQAAERKITFTQTGDNAGPSGNICIGCDMTLTHPSATSLTQNVIIDGSYEGDGERWLTLETAAGVNKYNGPILIYGNVKNSAVRNTKMIVLNGSGSSNYGVVIRTQTGSVLAPESIIIENNYIQNLGGAASQGIYFQRAGTSTANPSNVSILNNELVVATRGIFMGANSGTTLIKGNSFKVRQAATGMMSYGIWGYQNVEGTIEIAENKFLELSTAASGASAGIVAIQVGVGGDWNITNNSIAGFNATSAAEKLVMKGIASAMVGSVNIAHNTIVLNQLLNAPSAAEAGQIVLLNANGATAVKNNLVASYETTALNALVANASEACTNNIYYTDETAANAYLATDKKTLADYQAIEPTAKLVQVTFTDAAAGDLSLAESSVGNQNLGVARLDNVLTDIVGKERATTTYAGCYEASDLTDIGSAVENLTLNGVWYADGIVYNTENVMLYVYNVNGMLVASGMNNINMNGQTDGMYIVRSAEGALKFVK